MQTVTIIFNDPKRTQAAYSVADLKVHIYRTLELTYADGSAENINLDCIFSWKIAAQK